MDNLKVVEKVMNITLRREVVAALTASCVGTTLDVGEFFEINHSVYKADYSVELHCCLAGLAQRYKTAHTFIIGVINNWQNDRIMEHKLKEACIGLGVDVNLLGKKNYCRFVLSLSGSKGSLSTSTFPTYEQKKRMDFVQYSRGTTSIYHRLYLAVETLDDHESDYSESDMEHVPGATQVVIDLTGEEEMLDLNLC